MVDVASLAPRASVSVGIEADRFVAVERSMYAGTGGHVVAAVPQPARHWMFTQWLIGGGYDEWLPLLNPGDKDLVATVTVTSTAGVAHTFTTQIRARQRATVHLERYLSCRNGTSGCPSQAISVDASGPVVAEHVAYFNKGRDVMAHAGISKPSTSWYFATGRTDGGRTIYLPVTNPAAAAATITLTLLMNDGTWLERYVYVGPHATQIIGVHHYVQNAGVSIILRATVPVYAEESAFQPGRNGGALTVGTTQAAHAWYLAEGNTDKGSSESIVVLNPGSHAANVRVRYVTSSGFTTMRSMHIAPRSRVAWDLNPAVLPGDVAIAFRSDVPIVVGRRQEFGNGRGLTAAVGILNSPTAP